MIEGQSSSLNVPCNVASQKVRIYLRLFTTHENDVEIQAACVVDRMGDGDNTNSTGIALTFVIYEDVHDSYIVILLHVKTINREIADLPILGLE